VPFGAFLGLVAPSWRWVQVLLVVAGSSIVLEVGQHLLSTGSFDITDVITNTAGGLLGLALLALARRTLGTRAPRVAARVLVAVTALGVVAAAVFVATPGHWTPQQDVIVPTPTPTPTPS
jgi:glycopeptide antibiotics resistance protein